MPISEKAKRDSTAVRFQFFCAAFLNGLFNVFLNVFERFLFQRSFPSNPKTILIVRIGHLGDTLCAIPALRAVRGRFPEARQIFMTNSAGGERPFSKDVLEKIIAFDEVIAYDPARIYELGYLKTICMDLKSKKIDLLVYLGQNNVRVLKLLRDMLFFRAAGCKSVCGFRLVAHRFFPLAQRFGRNFDTESLRLMKLVKPLGISDEMNWSLPAVPFKPMSTVKNSGPLVAIHPYAKYPVKRWPIERFIKVAKHLQAHDHAFIVMIGGKDTIHDAKALMNVLDNNLALDLTGKTNFLETAEVLRHCRLLLSNDSGPVHIAGAVNTPVVGIYSARDYPNTWYPWGNNHHIFRKDVNCQICYLEECPVMTCIKNVTPEEVIVACDRILEKTSGQRPSYAEFFA